MPIKFSPTYLITSKIVQCLMRIEATRTQIINLPLTPTVLASLRETARLYTTHYSTMIEGNRLEPQQVEDIVKHEGHFPGRERDEKEVLGYYAALTQVEQWVAKSSTISEKSIQSLHAIVMAHGTKNIKPTPYRDGQNVIRDGRTRKIIYMPPEAGDVPKLMHSLVEWINANKDIPCPIIAAIAHYQFATIHPYFDGNGRTARLLTTMILHLGGYDLKGLYSLEEYYARNLDAYYSAISVGESHNYYLGRAEADITQWITYFVEGMAVACERVLEHMREEAHKGLPDQSTLLRTLDPRQRKALELLRSCIVVTAKQLGELFGFKPRTSTKLCKNWVDSGFLVVVNASNKNRSYTIAKQYKPLITQ